MHELSQSFYFEAAHTLSREIQHDASIRIHGHTYHGEVTVIGMPDSRTGMLIDLGILRSEIERVRAELDHQFLDKVEGLNQPTLENLCSFIYGKLHNSVAGISAVCVERRASGDRCVLRLDTLELKTASTKQDHQKVLRNLAAAVG